jgi:hypothetical protein
VAIRRAKKVLDHGLVEPRGCKSETRLSKTKLRPQNKLLSIMWPTPFFHYGGDAKAAVRQRLALSLLASIFFLYTTKTTTIVGALEASSFPRNTAVTLEHPHSTHADHSTTTTGSSIGSGRGHEKASSSSSSTTNNDHGDDLSSHNKRENKAVTSSAAHLERGVPLPVSLEPKELYDVFRRLRRHYQEKAASHHHHHNWQVMYQYRNITISMLHHDHDPTCPYVKMEAYIPVPTTSCWDFLKVERWDDSMPKMDSFYEGTQVYGTYQVPSNNATVTLCRKRMTRLFAFGKRDMVFLSVEDKNGHDAGNGINEDNNANTLSSPSSLGSATNDDDASGMPQNHHYDHYHRTLVSGSVSVVTDAIPRQKGYTRAYQDSISYYRPVPRHANDMRKTATYVFVVDVVVVAMIQWLVFVLYVT